MSLTKFILAFALFVSSVTFEEQVLVSKNSIDSHWTLSISIMNESFAAVDAAAKTALF